MAADWAAIFFVPYFFSKTARNLAENPEEAAHAEEDLGGYRSDALNKLDNDSTRRKKDDKE